MDKASKSKIITLVVVGEPINLDINFKLQMKILTVKN